MAVVEEDQLSEIYYERENEYTLAGSIYKGRVTRVLPGMQSAFVNIGLERDAFLYVSDFLMEEDEDSDAIGEAVASSRNSPIIEVRSSQGHDGPIEAQEIMPPITVGDEEDDQSRNPPRVRPERRSQEQEREGAANGADAAAAEEADAIVLPIAAHKIRQLVIAASRKSP